MMDSNQDITMNINTVYNACIKSNIKYIVFIWLENK